MSAPHETLALYTHWEKFLHQLLDSTSGFPRHSRFTFSSRIDGLALDILESLVTACYATGGERVVALESADNALLRLRVLMRAAHRRRFLSSGAYESLARGLDEAGRMLGGWLGEAR